MTAHVKDAAATLIMVWNTLQAKLASAVRPDELLMTPDEVAAYTGLTVQALAMMRHRGKGPSYSRPSSRMTMYRKGDVDRWIAAGQVDVVSPDDARLKNTARVTPTPAEGTRIARTPQAAERG